MKTAAIGCLVAACLAGAARADAALPREKHAWIEVRTPNFVLYSNAGESRTKAVGFDLERFRSVLLMLGRSFTANAPVPTFVFVFKNEESLKPYLPVVARQPMRVAGYFQPTNDGNYIALCTASGADPRSIVYHEYLHYFMHANFAPQPLWYSEGVAEFYSTFRATEKSAEIGRPVEGHVELLRSTGLVPLEKLFAVAPGSPDYNEESKQGIFYAQSWALVHYLMRGEPKRKEQLGRFLVQLQQGRPQDEAFREAFGVEYAALLRELAAYVRRSAFVFTRLSFGERMVPSEATVRRMPYEETLFRLGDLVAHSLDERVEEAEAHFQAALARRPSYAEALSGLGWLRLRSEQYEEAADLFRRAVAGNAGDYRAHFYYGELRMRSLADQSFGGSLDPDQRRTLEDARSAFRRSIELNGGFPEARAALGRTYLVEDDSELEEGIAQLEAAVKSLPSRTDLALDLARLYERKGETGKREALLKTALGPQAARAALAKKEAFANFQATIADKVNRLLAERREEEALELFEQELAAAPPDVREAYQEELNALRRGAARNRAVRLYNEAVAKLNQQDLEGALALFEKVGSSLDAGDLASAARENAERIRKALDQKPAKRPGKGI